MATGPEKDRNRGRREQNEAYYVEEFLNAANEGDAYRFLHELYQRKLSRIEPPKRKKHQPNRAIHRIFGVKLPDDPEENSWDWSLRIAGPGEDTSDKAVRVPEANLYVRRAFMAAVRATNSGIDPLAEIEIIDPIIGREAPTTPQIRAVVSLRKNLNITR